MLIIGLLSSTSINIIIIIIIITELRAAQRGGGITGRGEKSIVVFSTHQPSKVKRHLSISNSPLPPFGANLKQYRTILDTIPCHR
jgi:hypothetical protein